MIKTPSHQYQHTMIKVISLLKMRIMITMMIRYQGLVDSVLQQQVSNGVKEVNRVWLLAVMLVKTMSSQPVTECAAESCQPTRAQSLHQQLAGGRHAELSATTTTTTATHFYTCCTEQSVSVCHGIELCLCVTALTASSL